MTREEAIKMMKAKLECMTREISGHWENCNHKCDECNLCYEQGTFGEQIEWLKMAMKALEKELCEDAISRQAVLNLAKKGVLVSNRNFESVCKAINDLPSVNPQDSKTEQFAKWVASEIFDDNWEYNKDAFAEIACRKLAKLGIVKANGDELELVKSQESEV